MNNWLDEIGQKQEQDPTLKFASFEKSVWEKSRELKSREDEPVSSEWVQFVIDQLKEGKFPSTRQFADKFNESNVYAGIFLSTINYMARQHHLEFDEPQNEGQVAIEQWKNSFRDSILNQIPDKRA